MARSADRVPPLSVALDPSSATPLHRQLYSGLRQAMLDGRLRPGTRVPSTRGLAADVGCSRTTAVVAYDLLFAEGYLEARTGSGTYVSAALPDARLQPTRPGAGTDATRMDDGSAADLSCRGQGLVRLARVTGRRRGIRARLFSPGEPDLAGFPFDVWSRLLARTWRAPGRHRLLPGPVAGDPALRRAIADHVNRVRGLACAPEQVFITNGTQQGLDLIVRLLLDPGDAVWVENPGYASLWAVLAAAEARPVPVPIDAEGLSVDAGCRRARLARMAVVTPSHAYPLGVVMGLARRLQLLDWAANQGAWVVEDDYDSEFRYTGAPLAALAGLDRGPAHTARRVLYLGTFSKILFPSLRVGYMIVPEALIEPVARARAGLNDLSAGTVQPALAAFLADGHFAQHLRRMRRRYAARQQALLDAGRRHLAGLLDLAPDAAGMHLVAGLAPDLAAVADDVACSAAAAARGLTVPALADYYLEKPDRQGLLLGYAAVNEAEIEAGIARLAHVLSGLSR